MTLMIYDYFRLMMK